MELAMGAERFRVASVDSEGIVIRAARRFPAGRGTLRLVVDRRVTTYHVYLPDGIDPERTDQSYQLLEAVEEAAA
jgi:hypothetical protein